MKLQSFLGSNVHLTTLQGGQCNIILCNILNCCNPAIKSCTELADSAKTRYISEEVHHGAVPLIYHPSKGWQFFLCCRWCIVTFWLSVMAASLHAPFISFYRTTNICVQCSSQQQGFVLNYLLWSSLCMYTQFPMKEANDQFFSLESSSHWFSFIFVYLAGITGAHIMCKFTRVLV